MSGSRHKWMRLALKVIFSVVGLILLTAQVSYKFYRLAGMPVFRRAQGQYVSSGYRPVSPMDEYARLSLDKRFDLKSSFGLLTPVFRFLHFAGPGLVLPCLSAPEPVDHGHVLTFLRGPPAGAGFS